MDQIKVYNNRLQNSSLEKSKSCDDKEVTKLSDKLHVCLIFLISVI